MTVALKAVLTAPRWSYVQILVFVTVFETEIGCRCYPADADRRFWHIGGSINDTAVIADYMVSK